MTDQRPNDGAVNRCLQSARRLFLAMAPKARIVLITLFGVLVLVYLFSQNRRPRYIPPTVVWSHVDRQAQAQELDPGFVYAIAFAESSFDAHARSPNARGIMQLSRPAWETASPLPYAWAWDWRHNVHAGVRYLVVCRGRLEGVDRFSYPLLAACYRYGFGHLDRVDFDLAELPTPANNVYRRLLAGERAPIPPP